MGHKRTYYKDLGEGDSNASLEFAKLHLDNLKMATSLVAQFKADATGDWVTYNVRFANDLKQEFHFSGLNVGYRGQGPRTLVKVLKLIGWQVNDEIIFINDKLQIARELPPNKEDKDDKTDD